MRSIVRGIVAAVAAWCMFGSAKAVPTIVSPADYSTVSTMSENLKSIIQSANMLKTSTFATAGTAARKMYSNEYCTNSLPVKLEWTGNAASYTVSVYRTRDIESGEAKALYSVTTSENFILYWDPEVGRNYTWTVDDGSSVAVGHFYTSGGVPRIIYADKNGPEGPGIDCLNGRDLGGWATTDGKVVKQSMIYRSAELETCNPTNSIGVRTEMPYLADVLGIKLDIDLRKTNEVLDTYLDYSLYYSAWKDLEISNISPDIPRYSAHLNAQSSFPSYEEAIIPNSTATEKKRANIWKVFEQFTIEDNYPIIFHCAHGKDRAGTVGYILLSVLGVPADNAKRDFGLSWLYYVDEPMIEGFGYTPIDAAVQNFPSYGGDTLKEQCENYLVVCARDAGVSETVAREKIAKFRSLMLEEPETQIASSDSETVTYTWTGNGGDNNWTNPANWTSPEDSYGYPDAENAVVYINDESSYINLEGATYKAKPIFGEEVKSVIFANGTLEVTADAFTFGAADMDITLNTDAKIVASGALKILGTLNVVIPEGGRDLPISAASLAADTAAKINLDLTDFSASGEVTIASFGAAFDSTASLEYTFTVADNTVVDRGTITTPESKAIVYSQDKKTGVISLPAAVTGLVYTGDELVGVLSGEGYTLSGDYKATDAGTYTAQVVLKDGYSFSDTSDGTVTWTIVKANNEWIQNPEISINKWNIGDESGTVTPGATKFGAATATISKDGGEAQIFDGQLPTTKGSYVITYLASGEGTDNYNAISAADLTKSVSFTITANPSDLTAYAGYVTYPEPTFFVNGIMKLGEGTTTAKIKYSVNSEACNNVKEVSVDKDGYFRVNIPYVNAEDTLTWEVEVVNSASSDVLTVAKSTIKRAHDPSRVTYKWRGKGADNKWRSLANWEGFSGTVGNNNPCCWGYPGFYNTAWVSHVHFDQSTGPEGIDLENQSYASIDNGFFVFEENVFVKMKNGTLYIPGGYMTFESSTVGLVGAKGSTLVINNVTLDNMSGKNLIPASGFTLVYEGNNTVAWKYNPTKSNSKFIVRDGTLQGNSFGSGTIADTHVVEISNGVWSVSQNVANAKGIGAKVIFRDGPDREAQFKTSGSLVMYGTYDIKIPATGKTKPAVQAKTLSSCKSNSKMKLDVTDYKSATKVPLVKFTSTTAQTAPTSTLEAYADGVNVTSERGAKLTFEDNILYYSQNEVKDSVVLEKIEKPEYATTSFTYDGAEKVVVVEGENYTVTGTAKATDAGSYTAVVTPNEGYAWADETTDAITISWSIAKATNEWTTEPSISLTEWTVGETAGVLTAGVAKFGDVAVTINGEAFTQMPTAVGTYAITYSVADSANYSALTKTVSFTIKAAPVDPEPEAPGTGGDEGEGEEPKLEIDSTVGYIVRDLGELKDQVAVVFTNANNYAWTMPKNAKNVEFLVVGGGGGGAGAVNGGSNNTQQGGAGGGGGAVVTGYVESLNKSDTLTITVGEGGDNGTGGSSTASGTGSAISGGTSSFAVGGISYITAYGGGGGGGYNTAAVAVGGSNSGGTKSSADTALATVTYIGADAAANIYGAQLLRNKGGVSYTSSSGYSCGGGGGGAATVGLPSTGSNIGGKGGSGFVSAITGESLTYGAGGGGGIGKNGGDSSDADDSAGHGIALKDGTSAKANQGGGGGGGSYGKNGGEGGSGIVVLRFAYSDKDVVVDVEANVKSKISSKAYTGSTLTSGVINTYAYSVEELTDDLINVGKKTVRVTLNEGYVWSDGDANKSKDFDWYIATVEAMDNGYKVIGLGEKGDEIALVFTNHSATINWTVPQNLKNAQFLVVGGGGGGGADNVTYDEHYQAGGGGGGGGVVTGFVNLNKDEIVSIKIGAGGKGGVRADNKKPYGGVKSQAQNSYFSVGATTITANAGGGDPGSTESNSTSSGAQIGGVGGSSSGSRSGATGRGNATRGKVEDSDGKVVSYTAFGNQGGAGASSYRAGGGGGATTEGKAASDVFGGAGGEGLALDITGTMVVYGSGGGGGAVNSGALGAGLGGTGAGNGGFTTVATSALANQSGGGGGGGRTGNGGNGGSGIVVIRYTIEPEWTPPMPDIDEGDVFNANYTNEVVAALKAVSATSVGVKVNGAELKGDAAVNALNIAVTYFDDALTFDGTAAILDIVIKVTEVNTSEPEKSKFEVTRGTTKEVLEIKEGANIKTSINEIDLGSDAVIFKLVIE
ncbi:MAG: tyrosine-protein phosphatase [Kiritimatiellae bacterium]|nr:tyrosine-protein phosphatase [Kiritimatiellia bacterium]